MDSTTRLISYFSPHSPSPPHLLYSLSSLIFCVVIFFPTTCWSLLSPHSLLLYLSLFLSIFSLSSCHVHNFFVFFLSSTRFLKRPENPFHCQCQIISHYSRHPSSFLFASHFFIFTFISHFTPAQWLVHCTIFFLSLCCVSSCRFVVFIFFLLGTVHSFYSFI